MAEDEMVGWYHWLKGHEFEQTLGDGDAIPPSHSLLPASAPALSLSQHRGLFQWVGSLHQVAKVLELQLQLQSFQWIFRVISFSIDCLHLLAVQGTLKSLLQHHSYIVDLIQHLFWHDLRVAFCITGTNYLPFHVQLPTSGSLTVVREISFYFWLRLIKNGV